MVAQNEMEISQKMEVRVETLKCQGGFLALSCGKKSWMNGDNILEGVRSGSSRDEEAPSHFLSVNFSAQPQTYSVRHPSAAGSPTPYLPFARKVILLLS